MSAFSSSGFSTEAFSASAFDFGTVVQTDTPSGGYEYTRGHPWLRPVRRPHIEEILPDAEPELVEAIIEAVSVVVEDKTQRNEEVAIAMAEKSFNDFLHQRKQVWIAEYSDLIRREYAWMEQENEDEQIALLLLNF